MKISTLNQNQAPALHVRTDLTAGNWVSDRCYGYRDKVSWDCFWRGWPQKDDYCYGCHGKNNESMFKECLYHSGEPDWWKAFPECTSSQQCYDSRPAYVKPSAS